MLPPHDVLPARHDFAAYARTNWPQLVMTARLLTDDPGETEELARRTLVLTYARWRRVPRDDADFHVRRALVKGHLRRLHGRRAARRRAVLVLRLWVGMADVEIAQLLGCSVGAVRAHATRGLGEAGADAGRLRERYARAVEDVVPSEVPLAGIETSGRALRRRRLAVASAACAALLTPAALLTAGGIGGGGTDGTSGGGGESAARRAESPVRVVALGERVSAVPGVRMWLTADGGHWSASKGRHHVQRLTDSGLPLDEPGVSARVGYVRDRFFLSGLYRGLRGDPARVEVRTPTGTITASVLTLAGSPGWGIWYASTPLSGKDVKTLLAGGRSERNVTAYDASGKVAARSGIEVGLV
ncbi:sigma factor-like helix-turn-helix DNA-binding protein [Streptomyces bluensis]|uniref:sigma factor-like helix-turn-helix DNA-binding protein n=1 Tax=Streptomyces bluensis TaxID=33897 RepID=UPI003317FAEC